MKIDFDGPKVKEASTKFSLFCSYSTQETFFSLANDLVEIFFTIKTNQISLCRGSLGTYAVFSHLEGFNLELYIKVNL